jgi:predicted HNH restriction endonuclease
METKTKYTAADTLNAVKNLTKKRLYELMNDGKISYEQEEWGNKTRRIINAAELVRVFGSSFTPAPKQETKQETVFNTSKKPLETQETALESLFLRKEIERLQEQIQYERKEKERERAEFSEREAYYRMQNDKLTDTITRQTLLLSDMRSKAENQPVEQRKGFFAWLVGSKA